MKYTAKDVTSATTSTGKPMWKATLVDETGKEEKLNLWDEIKDGDTIEGETYVNDKGYTNFKKKLEAPVFMKKPNMDRIMEKKSGMIAEAQTEKAKHIAEAQDRSAWMWAKTNASTLLANHPIVKTMGPQGIANEIIELATKIYNGEPTEPFSSPVKRETAIDPLQNRDLNEDPIPL
jgi:hypothetical protein